MMKGHFTVSRGALGRFLNSFCKYDDDGVTITDSDIVRKLDIYSPGRARHLVWAVFPGMDGMFRYGLK